MLHKTITSLTFLFLFFSFNLCSGQKRVHFKKIQETKETGLGKLYIYRPFEATRSIFDVEVEISKYLTNFRNPRFEFKKIISLESGEYKHITLPVGQYQVKLTNCESRFLILKILEKKNKYVALRLHANSFWHRAQFIMERENIEKALGSLLQYNRMFAR